MKLLAKLREIRNSLMGKQQDEETAVEDEARSVVINNYIVGYITVPPDTSQEDLITLGMWALPECYNRYQHFDSPMAPQARIQVIVQAISNALRQSKERDQGFEDKILTAAITRYGMGCVAGEFLR